MEIKMIPNKGRGVFATKQYEQGDPIEQIPCIHLTKNEMIILQDTKLHLYVFGLGGDYGSLLPLGYGGLYNHDDNPNAEVEQTDVIELTTFAKHTIKKGEEITLDYGRTQAKKDMYFNHKQPALGAIQKE